MNRRQLLAAGGAGVLGALAGCSRAGSGGVVTNVVEESFSAFDVDAVQVNNQVGDVLVRGADVSEVQVRVVERSTDGQAGLDDIRTETGVSAGTLIVRTTIAENANWFTRSSPSTNVTVTVPRDDSTPRIRSVAAELGDVTLTDVLGSPEVSTRLGDVVAEDVDGYPRLASNLGNVVARGNRGLDDVRSGLGDVDVEARAIRDDVEVRTELGDALVRVDPTLAATLVAVGDGSIAESLPVTDRQSGDRRVSGRLNGGGPELRVASDLGRVSIRPLSSS